MTDPTFNLQPSTFNSVRANGCDFRYELTGDGPVVTLLHGLSMTLAMWDRQVQAFAERFRVLRYDIRGLGGSGKPAGPYSIDLFAEDLAAILDGHGIGQTHLVAFSLGGLAAQVFALRWPERVGKLVLADSQSRYSAPEGTVFEARAQAAEDGRQASLVESRLAGWFSPEFRASRPDRIARYREMLVGSDPVGYAAAARTVPGFDIYDRLPAITAPTLVIVGDEDSGTPPEKSREIADRIPNARLVTLPGRHVVTEEAAEAFNAIVLDFLA